MDQLLSQLEKMGKAGSNAANKSLKEAARAIVTGQQSDGPKHKGGPSNGRSMHGVDALKVGSIKTAKSKNKYVQIGITDSAVWQNAQGIYFQHHGFYNKRTKKYIAGSQWMDKSFEKHKDKAASIMMNALEKELNL